MAQKDLIPVNKRSAKERKRITSLGGKASVEKRRRVKSFKEACQLFLEMQAPEQMAQKVKEFFPDLTDKDVSNYVAGVFAQNMKMLKGDLGAIQFIRDTAGEKPVDKSEVTGEISFIEKAFKAANERIEKLEAEEDE